MMKNNIEYISVPKKELECLREHLDGAMKIFQSLGIEVGGAKPPAKSPKPKKVSFNKGVDNFKKLLESGKKNEYPEHLKKRY